jgi:hypothetical protein
MWTNRSGIQYLGRTSAMLLRSLPHDTGCSIRGPVVYDQDLDILPGLDSHRPETFFNILLFVISGNEDRDQRPVPIFHIHGSTSNFAAQIIG